MKLSTILIFIIISIPVKISYANYEGPQVRLVDSELIYEGELNSEGFSKLKEKLINSKRKIKWLVIKSGGGEIDISMDIGFWVYRNGLNIRVQDVCLSSCANYIFPAGRKKVIEKNAIVAWHGSAIQENLIAPNIDQIDKALASIKDPAEREKEKAKIIKDYNEYISAMKLKQENFFTTIGVDQDITVIGQREKYNVKDYWAMSVDDMTKFGIMNVKAPANYPKFEVSKYSQVTHINVNE